MPGPIARSRRLVPLLACLILVVSCSPARDASFDITFVQTPAPARRTVATITPNPRRPTRIPTVTAPAVGPPVLAPGPAVSSTAPGVPTDSTPPAVGPGGPANAATPGPHQMEADPPGASGTPGSAGAPAAASGSQPAAIATVPPAPATVAVAPAAAPGGSVLVQTPVPAAPVAPGAVVYPGQVAEADGRYVTSSSRSARYYYSVDEKSWDRIGADHRVWFRTIDDLLRAFPDRIAYTGRSPRATRTPTPGHSSTP
jgi:hypothetical protein